MAEIVHKWWSVNTDRKYARMRFIKPLLTRILTDHANSRFYDVICNTYRRRTPAEHNPVSSYMFYDVDNSNYYKHILYNCISTGTPPRLKNLTCSNNMEIYKQIVPEFKYNAVVFPPYGDTKHHWYIRRSTRSVDGLDDTEQLVSLITNSKDEILNNIDKYNSNTTVQLQLHFEPLR